MRALIVGSLLAAGPTLELPWACGDAHACSQANGGPSSHAGFAEYAWDFALPVGTEVHAARAGTVARIEMRSHAGGCSDAFVDDANYVLIDHGDGTAGLYMHLEPDSSRLQLGDPVATGDVIARVGLTGYTCGPHLHFQVQVPCGSWWCQSVPAAFSIGTITAGELLERAGCDRSSVAATNAAAITSGCACDTRDSPSTLPSMVWFMMFGLGFVTHRRR